MADGPWVARYRAQRAARQRECLEEIMKQPWGREWIGDLIDATADARTFDPDPYVAARNQGRREFGLDLRLAVQSISNFNLYVRMQGERQEMSEAYLLARKNDAERKPLSEET